MTNEEFENIAERKDFEKKSSQIIWSAIALYGGVQAYFWLFADITVERAMNGAIFSNAMAFFSVLYVLHLNFRVERLEKQHHRNRMHNIKSLRFNDDLQVIKERLGIDTSEYDGIYDDEY